MAKRDKNGKRHQRRFDDPRPTTEEIIKENVDIKPACLDCEGGSCPHGFDCDMVGYNQSDGR